MAKTAKTAKAAENPQSAGADVNTPPEAPRGKLREFEAVADCIYQGVYTSAGKRVFSDAKSIPHFKEA
jgi:hypothetical protein